MTTRRILGIVAASLAVLVVAGIGSLYWLLSGDGVRRAIEQQASAWLGQPVAIASARVTLWPRVALGLRQVGVGQPVRVRLAEVDVSASPMALLSRRVEDAEVRIRNTRLDLPLPLALPASPPPPTAGAADATTQAERAETSAAGESSFRVVSVSSIVLDDVVVSSLGRELTISAESALVGSRVLLRELTADSGATSIRASGTVALEPRVDADLRIQANRLDVDELLALAAAFLPSSSNAAAAGPPPRLKATVSAATARAAGVDARQFAATMEVEGDRASLSPLTFEIFGGRYEGGIQARLGSRLNATLRAKLDGVEMAQVAAFGNSPDTISGRLSGSAAVSGAGRDLAEALAGARGNGTVLIADGTMRRMGLVRSIVLFFGRPGANAPPSTDRFDRLDAQFALAGGQLRAERFNLRSPDLDGSGSATLHLIARRLEGRMSVTLSEELSRQAGTDLRRYTREGDRIVLPVVLGGTLSEPRVTVDAAAALQRGLRNEAERRLKGILDRFR
jgi:uncharacterized protein involved in outer membrane biogenesis